GAFPLFRGFAALGWLRGLGGFLMHHAGILDGGSLVKRFGFRGRFRRADGLSSLALAATASTTTAPTAFRPALGGGGCGGSEFRLFWSLQLGGFGDRLGRGLFDGFLDGFAMTPAARRLYFFRGGRRFFLLRDGGRGGLVRLQAEVCQGISPAIGSLL